VIYGQLGVVETEDQAEAAKAIGRWSYVDSTRIGIWGWAMGFMSLNALFGIPRCIALPWRWPRDHRKYYDNIYTERYNGLPKDNRRYDAGSRSPMWTGSREPPRHPWQR
jgi:dipeptidyl-peptidase-4